MTTEISGTVVSEPVQVAEIAQEPSNPVTEVKETEASPEAKPEKSQEQIAFEKRIARQTAANKETNRQLQEARTRIAELEAQTAKANPLADKPNQDNFDTLEEYAEALADWKIEQRSKEVKEPSVEDKVSDALKVKEAELSFRTKEEAFRASNPDYDKATQVVNGLLKYVDPNSDGTKAFATTLMNAPNPPALVHYLGTNPSEAIAMMQMSAFEIQDRLGMIIDQLDAPKAASSNNAEEPEEEQLKAPPLPAPPSALKSGNAKASKSMEDMSGKELLARFMPSGR